MYNYYTFEKEKRKEYEKELNFLREKYHQVKHKGISSLILFIELTKRLVKNYDNRIQKFVLYMAKNPLIIKDYINPIESTRKQLMKETFTKKKNIKEFTLKPFVTEKERIVNKSHL